MRCGLYDHARVAIRPSLPNFGDEQHRRCELFTDPRLLFLERRLDRAVPGTVIILQQLLGRGDAALDEGSDRLEIAGLIAALGIAPGAALEPGTRKRETFPREIERGPAADRRPEAEPRHVLAQLLALFGRPALDPVPRGIERSLVVQQADPERRQGREPVPRPAVGAAHLQIA